MRPVVRSGSVLRSVGEDGLVLSMGVRPGPRLSSERRLLPFVRKAFNLRRAVFSTVRSLSIRQTL